MNKNNKKADFNLFRESIKYCNLCNRMKGRNKVLSEKNGNINSKVLFLAEAPGRLGADKTLIPLYGDKAGDNFNNLLSNIGWSRDSVFISNAVLCNPRQINGNNATPTQKELDNCSHFLKITIEIINPEVIIALGLCAIKALNIIQPHYYSLKDNVGKLVDWADRKLFIAYHPGQRALLHRSLSNQRSDFHKLSKLVHPINGLRKKNHFNKHKNLKSAKDIKNLLHTVYFIVNHFRKISKFKLTKLLYLSDFYSIKHLGSSITNSVYLRQSDGPWPPKLNDAIEILRGYELSLRYSNRIPYIYEGPSPRFTPSMDDSSFEIINEVVRKYGSLTNAQIKTITYRTPPMKEILKREKRGEKLFNCLVIK